MFPTWLRRGRRRSRPSRPRTRSRFFHPRLETLEGRLAPATFLVTNTNDAGPGSLRQAILDANAEPGLDTIAFQIGDGGVQTIRPTSALPTVTDPVIIDGTTQGGCVGTPLIVVDGSSAGATASGLVIVAGNSTVTGLVINSFANDGIGLQSQGGNIITGNYLGTDATGTRAAGNGIGVFIMDSSQNRIGGTLGGAGNLISGNQFFGVDILSGQGNQVQGNYIGTDVTGTNAVGNGAGVAVGTINSESSNNLIGGTAAGAGNLISGNRNDGVDVFTGSGNRIQGNSIGTDVTGTHALGNANGVLLSGSTDSTVGGEIDGAANLISGNRNSGVTVVGSGAMGNVVAGNYIGTNASGADALGNDTGVVVGASASGNTIGGLTDAARNVISGNSSIAIDLVTVSGNLVEGNYIGTNATGTQAVANGTGVRLAGGSTGNTVGGLTATARNVISGNRADGIDASGSGVVIQGNYIGTDVTGTAAINNATGISITGSGNTVGGTAAGARNLISGNALYGINISSAGNVVQGNFIGTDVTGTSPLGDSTGVNITGARNQIGGTAEGAGNLISGNLGDGLSIFGGNDNVVEANRIGTDVTGTTAVGNVRGVFSRGMGNRFGGTAAGAGNIISGNRGNGLELDQGTLNLVQGNYIGVDVTGTQPLGNGGLGASVNLLASSNIIGGATGGAGNLISANEAHGILLIGGGNQVQGNFIGTDVTGTVSLGNFIGVLVNDTSANNIIGGTVIEARNLISGNRGSGLLLAGAGNVVQGNYLGTDVTGTAALGNLLGLAASAGNNTIGGTEAGAGNLVSGNNSDGISLFSTGNRVQGNLIGTAADGIGSLGNGRHGVFVGGADNMIGGTTGRAGNTIAFNGQDGVVIDGGTGNAIRLNSIFSHTAGLGIRLTNAGNNNQAAPVVTSATSSGGITTIQGVLSSRPNTTFVIEFFTNAVCNPSGFGEGESFLDSTTVTTDGTGRASFTFTAAIAVDPGQFITATATDPNNNTSQFSRCVVVTGPGSPSRTAPGAATMPVEIIPVLPARPALRASDSESHSAGADEVKNGNSTVRSAYQLAGDPLLSQHAVDAIFSSPGQNWLQDSHEPMTLCAGDLGELGAVVA